MPATGDVRQIAILSPAFFHWQRDSDSRCSSPARSVSHPRLLFPSHASVVMFSPSRTCTSHPPQQLTNACQAHVTDRLTGETISLSLSRWSLALSLRVCLTPSGVRFPSTSRDRFSALAFASPASFILHPHLYSRKMMSLSLPSLSLSLPPLTRLPLSARVFCLEGLTENRAHVFQRFKFDRRKCEVSGRRWGRRRDKTEQLAMQLRERERMRIREGGWKKRLGHNSLHQFLSFFLCLSRLQRRVSLSPSLSHIS